MARTKIRRCQCSDCNRKVSETRDYHQSINRVMLELDERSRRLFAGMLARQMGRGGSSRVHEITGLSRVTIRRGVQECEAGQSIELNRVRRRGGGRPSVEKKTLESLIDSMDF